LVAPVLAVWVTNLATAGLTTPFDGDHDVFAIASFLHFVDFASSSTAPISTRPHPSDHAVVFRMWWVTMLAGLQRHITLAFPLWLRCRTFAFGGRYTYRVYLMSNLMVGYYSERRIGTRVVATTSKMNLVLDICREYIENHRPNKPLKEPYVDLSELAWALGIKGDHRGAARSA